VPEKDALARYKGKRDFTRTAEPSVDAGARSGKSGEQPVFVVQIHDARRMHFDFRLEVDGVLKSWAVPRGPSTDPHDKRLATPTEDHPLAYRDFEGVIPHGEYGGGTVIVWDEGTFRNLTTDRAGNEIPMADAIERGIAWHDVPGYVLAQCAGGIAGAVIAHLMFGLEWYTLSTHARSGAAQVFSEFVASFGLVSVIWGCSRVRSAAVPFAVGCYIASAYWFTASTSFANPAVTIARAFSNTFAGIRPSDVPSFIAAQIAGSLSATLVFRWLIPGLPVGAKDVVLPQTAGKES